MEDKPDTKQQPGSLNSQSTNTASLSGAQKPLSLMTALIIIVSISSGFLGGWLGADSRNRSNEQNAVTEARQQIVSSESELISEIAKNTGAGVVSIDVTSQAAAGFGFFGFTPMEQMSAGTGFIINEEGIILTNRHVIPDGVSSVSVTLADGTQLTDVEVIGKTSASDSLDVAFLKIRDAKGKKLSPVRIGDSSKVQVGEKVVAIGNALGQFQNTVTSGIISGYGRSLIAGDEGGSGETLQNLFQTDAAINQGNSGGPLVNMSGDVIGINTAVAGGRAENLGFAIPIDDVKGLIKSVLTKGKLERPYLGVRYVNLTDDYAYQYNLSQKRGAYILPGISGRPSILPDSPAAKAGLKEKDIITKIDGEEIDENHSLISLIGRHSVGDEVTLTILRDGNEQTVRVTLEAAPTS